ncbi:hypothetical protein [Natronomonas sp. LN261]|jgi:hypothetical protein|uniref:hypothetical protein n=1 Tax=Natronomonas sp. LN261 TaxID=2750669 RepID=UPI001C6677CE|nr:hypothetical protein [Natronomonas sp. LN261]
MADDTPQEKPRGDQMTTDFFEKVLASYLEEDRLESGVLRLDIDDGRTRRLIIDDDTGELDRYEYIKRELEEVIYLIEENEDLLDEPVELPIPVGDTERVIEEAKEEDAVTTVFQAGGIKTVLEHLHAVVGGKQELAREEESTAE